MQVFLQQIKNSLNQNPNLKEPEDFKEDLFRLIQTMCERAKMYHINLKRAGLLVERLKTFSIEGGSKFVDTAPYHYNVQTNKVVLNPEQIDDFENTICQALLEMVLIKEPGKGIDKPENVALKRGTLEIFANNLVGNKGEKQIFEDEQIIVNLMNCITKGQLLDSILTGNNELLERTIQEHELEVIRDHANYNLVHRQQYNLPLSKLPEIEQSLICNFFRRDSEKKYYSIEERTKFTSLLVFDANVLGNPQKYIGMNRVQTRYKYETQYLQQTLNGIHTSEYQQSDVNVISFIDYLSQSSQIENAENSKII